MCKLLLLKLVLRRIEKASEFEINEIIYALISWQAKRYREYEMVIMSLSKYDREKRDYQLKGILEMLGKQEYERV